MTKEKLGYTSNPSPAGLPLSPGMTMSHPFMMPCTWCLMLSELKKYAPDGDDEYEHLRAREKLKADGRLLLANLTQTEAPPTTEVLFKNTCGRCGFMFTNVMRHFTCELFLYV